MSRLNAGAITSQGDYAQGTAQLRASTGADGTGFTIGVLSDSYNCYAHLRQHPWCRGCRSQRLLRPTASTATATTDIGTR